MLMSTTTYFNEEYDHCMRCGRTLKNPKYREVGMGKVCQRKSAEEKAEAEARMASKKSE